MFGPTQVLLHVPYQNWQPSQVPNFLPLPSLQPGETHPTSSWWTQACLIPCQGRHLLKEGFGLSSSPGLRRRGAGWDVILPEAKWLQIEVWLPQALHCGPRCWQPRPQGPNKRLAIGRLWHSAVPRPLGTYLYPNPPSVYLQT